MKRLAVSICICALLAALSASSSLGFSGGFDYIGKVKGEPISSVGLFVKRSANGSKRVTGFTVTRVPYTCRDASPDITEGWAFEPRMPVESRLFEGEGDWIGLPLDPVGKVSGELRRGGVATGELKLRGELAGSGTHCRTGPLEWRATKPEI